MVSYPPVGTPMEKNPILAPWTRWYDELWRGINSPVTVSYVGSSWVNVSLTYDPTALSITSLTLTGATATAANVVTRGTADGPVASLKVKKWMPIVVDGVQYYVELYGV